MYDPLTNPPAPEWNSLSNDERTAICRVGEMYSCPCCGTGDAPFYIYLEIRKVLKEREKRVLKATMDG